MASSHNSSYGQCRVTRRKSGVALALVMGLALLLAAGGPMSGVAQGQNGETIVFGDFSWDSAQVHNRIAGFIVEHGYGYEVDYLFGDTMPIMLGMERGDVDVALEMWIDNVMDAWNDMLDSGAVMDLGPVFPDAVQGWYVPTYMIEGDPDRGIEATAPDLRSVDDLPQYWELFTDMENPNQGRFYNCSTGWACRDINVAKLEHYGLNDTYDAFSPGSEAALNASIARAYERGEPWVGYYWEPTWVMGLYDMTLLDEPAYNEDCWEDWSCAYPAATVRISAGTHVNDFAPDVVEFLRNYETELSHSNEFLAQMELEGLTVDEAALWFLQTYEDVWTGWVPADVAARVQEQL